MMIGEQQTLEDRYTDVKNALEAEFQRFLASPTEEAFKAVYQSALKYGPVFAKRELYCKPCKDK